MDDALEVLREVVRRAPTAKQRGPDVRLALRALRFLGVPAADIAYFWDACASENEIGRSQNMNAALNGIMRRVESQTRSGR
jgi:hypothetical protein